MPETIPRTNTELFGHSEAEARFLLDLAAGKLAHGWIISGPRGIGKATLAYRFAKSLLSQDSGRRIQDSGDDKALFPPNPESRTPNPILQRIAANSHADLLIIEPNYDEKKEEYAREISVEQAREIAKFLSLTPGEGQWRVVIIDSADALNINAANAILKILEEPPDQSVILLISHNPGKLLPTIRSRCRNLKLTSLGMDDFSSVLRHIAPDIDGSALAALAQLSFFSPGVAIEMHEQEAVEVYGQILELLSSLPVLDTLKLHAFADRMTATQVHSKWQLLTRLVLCLFERITMQAANVPCDPISSVEAQILRKAAALHPAAVWAAKWQQVASQFLLAEARHLDYKQIIITFFHSIANGEVLVTSANG